MEKHFYLREGLGPGAYLPQDFIHHSKTRKASEYSMPKKNRGLLTKGGHASPGPMEYNPEKLAVVPQNARFKMTKSTRDIPFSKYSSQHSELVKKGIY